MLRPSRLRPVAKPYVNREAIHAICTTEVENRAGTYANPSSANATRDVDMREKFDVSEGDGSRRPTKCPKERHFRGGVLLLHWQQRLLALGQLHVEGVEQRRCRSVMRHQR